MIKLKLLLKEIDESVLQKINSIPERLRNQIGLKIVKYYKDRNELHQGHSGHKWNGLNQRMTNIENVLEKLGFTKIRNLSGETEIEQAVQWLFIDTSRRIQNDQT